ncbi:MAG: hypothetical protein HY509_00680, partial [Acidobacteria bacterium]|nr:hypothetical protein [Acidobacteriota bacterium]
AWYSGARSGGPVEVVYAMRKHLRRGSRPGEVRPRRFRSVRIAPADPLGPEP